MFKKVIEVVEEDKLGLDTGVQYKNAEDKRKFVRKAIKWLIENNLTPQDVDVFYAGDSDDKKGSWESIKEDFKNGLKNFEMLNELEDNMFKGWFFTSCHSRILAGDIAKVEGAEEPWAQSEEFDFYRNMDAKETLDMGKKCMAFLDKAIENLPKGHKIANGYTMDKDGKWIPAGYMDTKESLEYAKKQARWFIMVGECGYGTYASY